MGTTLKPVPFFDDQIRIKPHTASAANFIGWPVTLAEFADGMPCSLYEIPERGELLARVGVPGCYGYRFIQGGEV